MFGYGSATGYDVYLGFNTGTNNPVNSQENVGVGVYTLNNNNGWFNAAVGVFTLQAKHGGSYNTALGFSALTQNTLGLNNTAVGSDTLEGNTTANGNTAIGANALMYATGNNNTAVGYSAGPISAPGITNTTSLGANSYVGESNALILGGLGQYAVSVGIGTGTPYIDYALDVEATPGGLINGGVVVNATGGIL